MSTRYVNIDRETLMLLPPDLKEWVAGDDLVHFILEAMGSMDLRWAMVNERGCGSRQYPPGMMLAVLIYSYAHGIFSSRKIERATYRDLSVRYLSGNTHPDHDTIANFRKNNGKLIGEAFVHVLRMAKEMKFLKLGTISVDGTKMGANASKRRTLSMDEIEKKVGQILQEAEEVEASDTDEGDRLPDELLDPKVRQAKMKEALERIREREKAEESSKVKVNLTDGDSQLMPAAGKGFIQGYNAQLAVSTQSGLIVSAAVCTDTNDRCQLTSTVKAIPKGLGKPKAILADTGYDNQAQIAEVEASTGALVYCSPQSSTKLSFQAKHQSPKRQKLREDRLKMKQRLESRLGQKLYRLRSLTVEPVFGILKHVLGFKTFSLRGLLNVNLEWKLVALAFNCKKMARIMG